MTASETFAATPEHTKWEPIAIEELPKLLADFDRPWWIAGGWALDLFIGRVTRAHTDVEVSVFRDDIDALRRALKGWEFFIAESGTLTPWREREPLPKEAHELWSREKGRESWQLEVLIEERSGDRWTYRRDPDIGVRATDIGRTSAGGLPYIRPEIQLLYKSKASRPVDETDFITVLPHLDPAQKAFLSAALWTTAPNHRWLQRLG